MTNSDNFVHVDAEDHKRKAYEEWATICIRNSNYLLDKTVSCTPAIGV